ncbi:hypothetical protein MSG28_001150 [Choristoneura fumiferana]|uniref:Uncharacterized protein n=1 Tax=Choristoneura fumiferana TaxID=7141 RepID=A0ACC0K4H0_CHOFU|nr:hypothetical protein MSG28_001150 [Choristoneura fumiferana]
MDHSIFLQYSPPNGLPQESKLATYMNRSTSTPTRSLNQALGKLSLESSPTAIKKVLIGEFMPVNYFTPFLPESPESSPPSTLANVQSNTQVHQENVGGTTYFYSTNSDSLNTTGALNSSASIGPSESCLGVVGPAPVVPSPYAAQMYAGTPTHMGPGPMAAKPGLAATFYMPETIRSEVYQRNEEVFLQTDLRQFPDLPENVEMYTELTPIECTPHAMATSYRATHRATGAHVALRRLHAPAPAPAKRLDLWKNIDHPNVVKLHDAFTTKAFGDHSLVLVYDYHPACVTVMNKYLSGGGGSAGGDGNTFHDPFSSDPDAPRPYTHQKNAMLRAVACGALLPEAVLWSLLVQLTAALRAIHTAGLACRTLDPTKVVMNGCRVRVAWCGVADALHNNTNDVGQAQQEDLTALGRLALALACRTVHCDNLPASMDLVARTYSADLKNLILYLLSTSPARRSVTDLMPMIGARFYTQVEALERRADAFEDQLAREIDNGRLLRILIKLGVVNERPELNMDASWSETGDRYMLKLFRDYLFHSVGADGRPWLDYAHLSHCLNQLDGGTNNRVELMSRDEQSMLVVSYAELKHCLEQSFEEVTQASGSH